MKFIGEYNNKAEVWAQYPAGGLSGETLKIGTDMYQWNAKEKDWTKTTEPIAEGLARESSLFKGDVDVNNDLNIGGVLRARIVRGRTAAVGLYDSEAGLISAVPNPQRGQWALVKTANQSEEDTFVGEVYVCRRDGVWADAGYTAGSDGEGEAYLNEREERQAADQALQDAIMNIKPVVIEGDVTNNADEEDITAVEGTLKLKDKAYLPATFSGLGRVMLRKNIVNGVNILTQDMMPSANTIYVVQYDFELGDSSITIPNNCVLEFNGGSIKNGSITFSNTLIITNKKEVFDVSSVSGTLINKEVHLSWWKLSYSSEVNEAILINQIIALCDNCIFYYDISSDVYVGGYVSEVSPNPEVSVNGDAIHIAGKNYIDFRQTTPYFTILKGPSRYGDMFDIRGNTHVIVSGVRLDGNNIRHQFIGENGFGVVDCEFADISKFVVKNTNKGYDKETVDGDIYYNHYPEWGSGGKGVQIEGGITHAFVHDGSIYNCYAGLSNNQSDTCTVTFDSIQIEGCNIGIISLRLRSTVSTTTFNNIMLLNCTGENGLICMGNVYGVTISNVTVRGSVTAGSLIRGSFTLCNIDITCAQQCGILIDSALFRDNPEGDTSTLNNVHVAAGACTSVFGITPLTYPKMIADSGNPGQYIEGPKYSKYNGGKFVVTCVSGNECGESDLTKLKSNSPVIELIYPSYSYKGSFSDILSSRNRLPNDIAIRGLTSQRPSNCPLGFWYFDMEINKPILWQYTMNGARWVDEKGYTPALSRGTTTQMLSLITGNTPTLGVNDEGYCFYNTTLSLPCYLKKVDASTVVWIKADGTEVTS